MFVDKTTMWFHSWKVIPSYLFSSYLGKNFEWHSNLDIEIKNIKHYSILNKDIFKRQIENSSSVLNVLSTIASQVNWCKKYMKIVNRKMYYFKVSEQNINYVGHLFNVDGNPKLWVELKKECQLHHGTIIQTGTRCKKILLQMSIEFSMALK